MTGKVRLALHGGRRWSIRVQYLAATWATSLGWPSEPKGSSGEISTLGALLLELSFFQIEVVTSIGHQWDLVGGRPRLRGAVISSTIDPVDLERPIDRWGGNRRRLSSRT